MVARAHCGLGNATVETVEIGAHHCNVFACVGLTGVLAVGVAARAWVGLDISG